MLAIIYLLLGSFLGWSLLSLLRRSNTDMLLLEQHNKAVLITRHIVWIAGSFFTGTLVLTWATYLLSYLFRQTTSPMRWGNALGIITTALFLIFTHVRNKRKQAQNIKLSPNEDVKKQSNQHQPTLAGTLRDFLPEVILTILLLCLSSALMFLTFYYKGTSLHISFTTFGDIGPHLAMMRSFSQGMNFPTVYPFFSGEGIRYHFLFQFLCGNLEFLGLRMDWAFNLPSLISYTLSLLLLHSLATRLTGHRATGVLAIIFFLFRSYFGFFKEFHLSAMSGASFREIMAAFMKRYDFMNLSTHDD